MSCIKFFGVFFAVFLLTSCATGRVFIPDDLTPAELIQRGQAASDRNRFNHALQHYEALIQRFPFNIDAVCAAEYEIAFIHYRQRRYDIAVEKFNALLARYEGPDAELLPPQFKILSLIVLERIEEIQAGRARPTRRR